MTLTGWLVVVKAMPKDDVKITGWSEEGWAPFFAPPRPPKTNRVSDIARRALAAVTPKQIEVYSNAMRQRRVAR